MFGFFLRTNPNNLWITTNTISIPRTTTTTTHLLLLHRFLHRNQQDPIKIESSSTASYLTNSCSLSPRSAALSAAQKTQHKTTQNADSILNFLKSLGFTNTQITKLITKRPELLRSSLEKTIKPKLDYFLSVGFSATQLADLVYSNPRIFRSSLENKLKPNLEQLTSIIGNSQKMYVAFCRNNRLLQCNLETNFLPNVRTLQSYGVRPHNIAKLARAYPRALMQETGQFKTSVESIKKTGTSPLLALFVKGVYVLSGLKPSTWKRKVTVYKSFGCSEEEAKSAFIKQPSCMLLSEEKIRRSMDFYVKKLNWSPSFVLAQPKLLCYSLEKRIIPRCSVMSVLKSKGLVNTTLRLYTVLKITDKEFLDKYVTKYADQEPQVMEAYNSKLEYF